MARYLFPALAALFILFPLSAKAELPTSEVVSNFPLRAAPHTEVDCTQYTDEVLRQQCEELKTKPPVVELAKPPAESKSDPVVTLADPKPIPMPVDGLPRDRQVFGLRLAHTSPSYWGARLDYEYQAWLAPSWSLVVPVRSEMIAGGHSSMQDLRLSAEIGGQHVVTGKVGTLYQQLRVGFWGDAFPAQASPSFTYVFDGEVGHRILDIYGLVSYRPTVTTEDDIYSEGSSGLWFGKKSGFRLAGAWDTELGVGPQVDVRIKKVRAYGTIFLGQELTIATGVKAQF